jgi:RNA polymerase sigma-70 factor (TIGR02943 family)
MTDEKSSKKNKIKREEVEQWFEDHGDGLYRFSLLRVGDSGHAEDLVQETFLAALKSWESYKGESTIRGWLLGIMKHKIADHFRKEGRFKAIKGEFENDSKIKEQFGLFCWVKGFGPTKWGNDPQEAHLNNRFLTVVNKCLEDLTPLQREIFVLREMEEYKTKEIEKISGMSGNHIRVTLYRARILMRLCIEKLWLNFSPSTGT